MPSVDNVWVALYSNPPVAAGAFLDQHFDRSVELLVYARCGRPVEVRIDGEIGSTARQAILGEVQ